MITYANATIPLILMIIEIMHDQSGNTSKLAAYPNSVTATGTLTGLKILWNILSDLGPKYGCYPWASKSWLIIKQWNYLKQINITPSVKKHLRAAISSIKHKDEYINDKIENWIAEIKHLNQIAKSESQASYSCFISAWRFSMISVNKHKLTFYMKTTPEISQLLQILDHIVSTELIRSILFWEEK